MGIYVMNKNAQSNGDHEVHNLSGGITHCLPNSENQITIGLHSSCGSAISAAKKKFPNYKINGCFFCSSACHTS